MNAYELDVSALRHRFDVVLEGVEMRLKAFENAKRAEPCNAFEVERAESAYKRAMLLYRSCELDLRSVAITRCARERVGCKVLLYCRQSGIRDSLEALLRIRGYDVTVTATLAAMKTANLKQMHSVLVAHVPPGKCSRAHLVDLIMKAAQPLPVLQVADAFPTVPAPHVPSLRDADGPGFRTVPVHLLVSELDHLIGAPTAETSKTFAGPSTRCDHGARLAERTRLQQ